MLLVYQHLLLEVNQQHVVVGIYYNLHLQHPGQHLHIKESPETLNVFPFLMRGFPSVILRTCVLIFARDDSHVVIVSPPLGVLGPFYELQVPFYRYTYAQIT